MVERVEDRDDLLEDRLEELLDERSEDREFDRLDDLEFEDLEAEGLELVSEREDDVELDVRGAAGVEDRVELVRFGAVLIGVVRGVLTVDVRGVALVVVRGVARVVVRGVERRGTALDKRGVAFDRRGVPDGLMGWRTSRLSEFLSKFLGRGTERVTGRVEELLDEDDPDKTPP